MSFDSLNHFFGNAHVLMVEIAVLIAGAVSLVRWIKRDIDDMKGPKIKE